MNARRRNYFAFSILIIGIVHAQPLAAQTGFDALPPSSTSGAFRFALIELSSDEKVQFVFSTEYIETRKIDADKENKSNETILPLPVEEVLLEFVSRDGKDGVVLQKDTVTIPFMENLTRADGSVKSVQRVRTETRTRTINVSDVDNKKKVRYSFRIPKTKTVMKTSGTTTREVLQTSSETETRTKIIGIDEQLVRVIVPTIRNMELSALSFSNIHGESQSKDEVA